MEAEDPQGKAADIDSLSRPTSTQPIQEYEGQIDREGKATSILVWVKKGRSTLSLSVLTISCRDSHTEIRLWAFQCAMVVQLKTWRHKWEQRVSFIYANIRLCHPLQSVYVVTNFSRNVESRAPTYWSQELLCDNICKWSHFNLRQHAHKGLFESWKVEW